MPAVCTWLTMHFMPHIKKIYIYMCIIPAAVVRATGYTTNHSATTSKNIQLESKDHDGFAAWLIVGVWMKTVFRGEPLKAKWACRERE